MDVTGTRPRRPEFRRATDTRIYGCTVLGLIFPVSALAAASAHGYLIEFGFVTLVAAAIGFGVSIAVLVMAIRDGLSAGALLCALWPWAVIYAFWYAMRWEHFCTDNCPPIHQNSRALVFGIASLGLLPPALLCGLALVRRRHSSSNARR